MSDSIGIKTNEMKIEDFKPRESTEAERAAEMAKINAIKIELPKMKKSKLK